MSKIPSETAKKGSKINIFMYLIIICYGHVCECYFAGKPSWASILIQLQCWDFIVVKLSDFHILFKKKNTKVTTFFAILLYNKTCLHKGFISLKSGYTHR